MAIIIVTSYIAYLLIYVGLIVSGVVFFCSADKNREKVHVAKRQELKHQQRDAMLAGRPVRTVIEEVEPLMFQSNPRVSCVRELPDLETLQKHRILTRNFEKPPPSRLETLAFVESTQSSGENEQYPILDLRRTCSGSKETDLEQQ